MLSKIKLNIYKRFFPFFSVFYYYGTKVYIPKRSHLIMRYLEDGEYEQKNINIIQALVTNDSVFIDVGANIGLVSLAILNKCPSCRVVSFEPSPNTIQLLLRTAQTSNFYERWHVIPKALGNDIGTLDFFAASPDMGAFDGFRDTKRAGETKKVSVSVTTLDNEWEAMGKPTVSFIKIDVEGAEIMVLQGATNCIKHERPHILIEWSRDNLPTYNIEPHSILDWASSVEYKIFSMPELIPINNPLDLKLQMLLTEDFLLAPNCINVK